MKHFWALPAVLRPALVLAIQHAFSVHDDLLAFPQYEVKFSEDYVTETYAHAQLRTNEQSGADGADPPSQVEQYTGHESHADRESAEKEKVEYEMMVLDKQRYLCSIPQIGKEAEQAGGGNDTRTRAEEERELARANDRGWELLSGMQGNCVYFISGWWSYRFCYNDGVRQFHQLPPARGLPVYPPVEDPGVEGYILGKVDGKNGGKSAAAQGTEDKWEGEGALELSQRSKTKAGAHGELVTRGESRYLVQKLEGGTVCDLTGKERRIEVQFHCNPATGSDRITLIKETSTCAYLMVIQTPRLCNDVAFLPPQKDAANAISCRPVFTPSEAETYQRDLKAHKDAVKETEVWEADPDAAIAFGMEHMLGAGTEQIVGDIVVGGHAIVPPGVKLEKSAIAGGGKETYIDTVADSEGRMLSKEEIKKLGLGDPKAVEKLKKELEKLAAGTGWKLDVIDTPRGREYRGIIGEEEEDQKAGSKARETKGGEGDEGDEGEGSQEEYYKEEL